MKVIGLTGGIGSGKSTVSAYMKEKGCEIIDADLISRQMTEKDSPALDEIREAFGDGFFLGDGSLDRKALGDLVFSDENKRGILQEIVTKKVVKTIDERLRRLKESGFSGIAVIDAPLLFECGMEDMADENWLVTAGLESRIERVCRRDGLSREQILSRIESQMSQEEKEKYSRCILDNSGTAEELFCQIDRNLERVKNED